MLRIACRRNRTAEMRGQPIVALALRERIKVGDVVNSAAICGTINRVLCDEQKQSGGDVVAMCLVDVARRAVDQRGTGEEFSQQCRSAGSVNSGEPRDNATC